MDPVIEIKARLPIEDLVRSYTQLTKKGRNFVGLCPFHNDSRPSFLVSPDKGICYCFPCQKGGDIFSFYQQIEGVDFKQAIKDLAERTGVVLEEHSKNIMNKDEKERLRDCLDAGESFYRKQLEANPTVQAYLEKRGVNAEEAKRYGIGFAPDSFTLTYEHLLKAGYSRTEIQTAGLAIQKDLGEQRMYDRFRNRLMFPIRDVQGRLIGFGGRTLGDDDAKYLNTPDSPLYRKSSVLYGIDLAAKAMREEKRVMLVEGYFDVLACRRAGIESVVATCGTALTEEHVKLIKRHAETVVLCLDQDRAGKDAAERAYMMASAEGIQVDGIVLPDKDPADTAVQSLAHLKELLTASSRSFLDIVLDSVRTMNLRDPNVRREALKRVLPMLNAIGSATERGYALRSAAGALMTTETALAEDIRALDHHTHAASASITHSGPQYTTAELTLALFFIYPRLINVIDELIEPTDAFGSTVYRALKDGREKIESGADAFDFPPEIKDKLMVLQLYCDDNGMGDWSEGVATREIRRNCQNANREMIRRKQQGITQKLMQAKSVGDAAAETLLQNEYQELLKLAKMAS